MRKATPAGSDQSAVRSRVHASDNLKWSRRPIRTSGQLLTPVSIDTIKCMIKLIHISHHLSVLIFMTWKKRLRTSFGVNQLVTRQYEFCDLSTCLPTRVPLGRLRLRPSRNHLNCAVSLQTLTCHQLL